MAKTADVTGVAKREFGEDALAALQAYTWPGNVRQLRNVVEWLLIMVPADHNGPIRADMLPPEIGAITPAVLQWEKGGEIMGLPLRDARELFEREYLNRTSHTLWRQYLPYRQFRGDGAFGLAPQAEVPWPSRRQTIRYLAPAPGRA